MAEAPASTSTEDSLPMQWKLSNQRSRKSGCSNIFSGVNLHQLHRLFRTAGDRDAEHRARLVWRRMEEGVEKEEEGEEMEDEAGLAQALVGLRVRARNKAGIRVEEYRDHKWLRTSGYLRFEEPLPDYTLEDQEADITPSLRKCLLPNEEHITEDQSTFKPSSWRLGVARQEGARDSERYLHRILH
ncbi:arginine vasopressin-induced protein 1 [Anabas testudineus]|uniref:arginine vasopressin-induced protein 1 n=1 Tax=Anabas testudineus TaxID=64144 RepID=UPI00143D84CF|nr:arginine vasopressin-induced protein 1 [Anabas testudineus]